MRPHNCIAIADALWDFRPGAETSPGSMSAAWSSARAISTGKLKTLLPLHSRPINLVFSQGPCRSNLEETLS